MVRTLITHSAQLARTIIMVQGSQRLKKYLNLEDFLEKSLKIKCALKSTGKSLKCLEKWLIFSSPEPKAHW